MTPRKQKKNKVLNINYLGKRNRDLKKIPCVVSETAK